MHISEHVGILNPHLWNNSHRHLCCHPPKLHKFFFTQNEFTFKNRRLFKMLLTSYLNNTKNETYIHFEKSSLSRERIHKYRRIKFLLFTIYFYNTQNLKLIEDNDFHKVVDLTWNDQQTNLIPSFSCQVTSCKSLKWWKIYP